VIKDNDEYSDSDSKENDRNEDTYRKTANIVSNSKPNERY
jgi:hypothetical protein